MKLRIFSLIMIGCFYSSYSAATENTEPNHGPNDCLLESTNNCPSDFLLEVFCLHDDQMLCNYSQLSNEYTLDDERFLINYSLLLFGREYDPRSPNILIFPVMDTYPEDTLHEIFEYIICDLSSESCYPEGVSGLTIYLDDVGRVNGSGPTDSAICQITPEACTGVSVN